MATVNEIWPIDTDCLVRIEGLKDEDGAYLDDAVLTGTLRDADGADVAGAIDLAFSYQGPDGIYEVVLPYTLALSPGQWYTLWVTAVADPRRAAITIRRRAQHISA